MGRKVPPYTIEWMTNTDPAFYDRIGPFLSRREVVAELGSPVWDDDDKTWGFAIATDGEVLGFVSVQPTADRMSVRSLYVTPEVRGDVIGTTLVVQLLHKHPSHGFTATATPASEPLFTDCGFVERSTRGSFKVMDLDR